MATDTKSQAEQKKTAKKDQKPLVPPDEQFWLRYSPHHEFPLSTLASFLLHALAFGMVAFVMWWWFTSINEELSPISLEPITVAGGGGNPKGEGNQPGKVLPSQQTEAADTERKVVVDPNLLNEEKIHLNPVTPNTPQLDIPPNARFIEKDSADPISKMAALKKQIAQTKIAGPVASKGNGGAGSGGGKGNGIGTGTGDLAGPGNSNISVRDRRQLRRTIKFDTLSGDDYRRQLLSLGAVLAVPEPSQDNAMLYRVYRDLTHIPVEGKVEDIRELNRKLNRIFWTDADPQSVASLSQALGLRSPPAAITAFFPHEFETDLLKKEMEYRHVKNEWEIRETVFKVIPRGRGYGVEVESQRLASD